MAFMSEDEGAGVHPAPAFGEGSSAEGAVTGYSPAHSPFVSYLGDSFESVDWSEMWVSDRSAQEWSLKVLWSETAQRVRIEASSERGKWQADNIFDVTDLKTAGMDSRLVLSKMVRKLVSLCSEGDRITIEDESDREQVKVLLTDRDLSCEEEFLITLVLQRRQLDDSELELRRLRLELKQKSEEVTRLKKENERLTLDLGNEVPRRTEAEQRLKEVINEVVDVGLRGWDDVFSSGLLFKSNGELNKDKNPLFIQKLLDYSEGTASYWAVIRARYLFAHRKNLEANVKHVSKYEDGKMAARNALHICAAHLNLSDSLAWFLNEGSIHPDESTNDSRIQTPLLIAAQCGNTAAVRIILNDKRTDRDKSDPKGVTPLMMAVMNNHSEVVSLLLDYECDARLEDKQQRTALGIAIEKKFKDIVDLLHKHGYE